MSADARDLSHRDLLMLAAVIVALIVASALRGPVVLVETYGLAADIARHGPQATACGRTLPGSGEVAAVLAAIDALQGADDPLRCTPDATYLRLAAS